MRHRAAESLTASGAYLGYRVGIAEDGTWTYFVAGDRAAAALAFW